MSEYPINTPARYCYHLPSELIAQEPLPERDGSRLLVLGADGVLDSEVRRLPDFLRRGDLLVVNDSRVMPARCTLSRQTGGAVEVLFLSAEAGPVEALVRPGRRLVAGEWLTGPAGSRVRLLERREEGAWLVEAAPSTEAVMRATGDVPLPPYINRPPAPEDEERYQTVFAGSLGSAAAPTAGLHFTGPLLETLEERGIGLARITLHVGPGTFRPLRESDLARGELHREWFQVSQDVCRAVEGARIAGGRVVAVGTTAARALESATPAGARVPVPTSGTTGLFIREGYSFRALDGLLTNFHLPGSSLLALVAALVGWERLLAAYQHAINKEYRFYSYGDAMLVL